MGRILLSFAFWFTIGYVAVMKVAPAVQAHIESLDLDDMWDWDVYDEIWSGNGEKE